MQIAIKKAGKYAQIWRSAFVESTAVIQNQLPFAMRSGWIMSVVRLSAFPSLSSPLPRLHCAKSHNCTTSVLFISK